jgi:sec-independent protein translocase protein TatC
MARLKAVSHEERLSLVEHLDELRTRIIVSVAVFVVAFGLCFWQSDMLIDLAKAPLPNDHDQFITFAVAEPFTTTVTICAYGALILSLPIVLYQLYAYVLPAFSDTERRAILPLLLLIPVLFAAGIVFAYFIVMPAATKFLLHFNEGQFNIQLRARDYFGFFGITLLAVGLIFQLPVAVVGATRIGVISPAQLRQYRRYAYFALAVVAAALPGVDPVTMILETIPLILLYELSIVLARAFGQPASGALSEPSTQEH